MVPAREAVESEAQLQMRERAAPPMRKPLRRAALYAQPDGPKRFAPSKAFLTFQDDGCLLYGRFERDMRHDVPTTRNTKQHFLNLKSMKSGVIKSLQEDHFVVPHLQKSDFRRLAVRPADRIRAGFLAGRSPRCHKNQPEGLRYLLMRLLPEGSQGG